MMIILTEQNTGNVVAINSAYFTEINEIIGADGKPYSRIYLSEGHRTFIDVEESMNLILKQIKSDEKDLDIDIRNALFMIKSEMGRIVEQLRKFK